MYFSMIQSEDIAENKIDHAIAAAILKNANLDPFH